jgi:hypothetical protein
VRYSVSGIATGMSGYEKKDQTDKYTDIETDRRIEKERWMDR